MCRPRTELIAGCLGFAILAVMGGFAQQRVAGFDLALVEVNGGKTILGRLPPSVFAPRLSPDGKRVAFETRDRSGPDGARLWIADLTNLSARRPVQNPVGPVDWAPIWTLDGERLVFIVSNERGDAVYWRRADGTGTPEHLLDARSAEGWMPDGRQMRFLTLKEEGGTRDYDIALFDLSSRTVTPLVGLAGSAQHSSAVSPDGHWLAYASNETGRYELWLEPLPRTGARYQITRNGGGHPLWLPDGRALYFDRGGQLFKVALNFAASPSSGDEVPLPIKGFVQGEYRRQFDLMPGGNQFVMMFSIVE